MSPPGPLRAELERLHGASFGWALGCCRWRRDEADEVLQAAYLKVLDGRARFDERSSVKTWLFSIIRRTAAERRRRQWLRLAALGRWAATRLRPAPAADPQSLLERSEEAEALRRALRGLTTRQRDLLHLVFYQDLTIDEAARVLGIGVGTARTHYDRGKASLRRRLAGAQR